jgi:putative endonuclease
MKKIFYFYILRCKDKSLYCGSTINIEKRLQQHNAGKGSTYVRSRGGGKLIYSEKYKTLSAVLRREAQVKKWKKQRKELLANSK